MDKIIVIAGGNGFLGRYLSRYMMDRGWVVRVIARHQKGVADGSEFYCWDGETMGDWANAIDGSDVVVNMAGRTVNCRYNDRNKKQIIDSRVITTKLLASAIDRATNKPTVWLNSSTATIYRHAEDRAQTDENGEIGKGFSVEVAKAWEKTFFEAEVPDSLRRVALRTAIVMANEPDTVFDVLCGLAKKGLGGKMGSGNQMVSWIHIEDFCRAVEWLISKKSATGCYNLSSPNPLTNNEMMHKVRTYVNAPFGLPATVLMLKIGAFFMRTETELILKSRWVLPTRLLDQGFHFEYEQFESLLD